MDCFVCIGCAHFGYWRQIESLIHNNERLNDAFDIIKSCFTSTNYSTGQCKTTDNTTLNNSNGYLICCKPRPVCYSSIDVVFMSGIYTLTASHVFTNLQNVWFFGNTSAMIKCSPATFGIAFIQIKNLTIENLNITGCGMNHTSTSTSKDGDFITHLSALYIQNSTNLLVANVNISNSNGTGLSIVDTIGTINIINSFFSNNRVTVPAELSTILSGGGGIYIEYTECAPGVLDRNSSYYLFANNSVIIIENCVFEQNHASYDFGNSLTANLDSRTYIGFGAGGGLSLQFNGQGMNFHVHVTIASSNFSDNKANNGGSLSLYSRYNTSNVHLNISCCVFVNNSATGFGGGGVVGDGADVGFHNNSVTIFRDNHGFRGGAFLLMRSSRINVHFNSTLIFISNVAVINGGAIYVHFATLFGYLISYSCFIRYPGQNIPINNWNARFIFIDNKAANNETNSIFTTTLRPCHNTYSKGFLNKHPFCFYAGKPNKHIDMYTDLLHDHNRQHCLNNTQGHISTRFCNVSNESVYVIPGKIHDLNVCIVDELDNQIKNFQFVATCVTHTYTCPNPNMPYVLPAYRINNGSIQIAGAPGSTCNLQLQTIEDFQITGAWLVKLSNCPPGFVYNSKDDVCTCLTDQESENPVIPGCEETVFQAFFNPFYWIGYKSDNATDLVVAPCPYQYCY